MTSVLAVAPAERSYTSTCKVLKGELVAPIPPGETVPSSGDQPPHNYRTLTQDSPATFYEDTSDNLSPLTPNEFDLLAGVKSPSDRYMIFTENRLDWGNSLKKWDKVLVEVPRKKGDASAEPCPRVYAVIRYVGPVTSLPGITFGVEIKVVQD